MAQQEFRVIYAAINENINLRSVEMTIRASTMDFAESYARTFMEMAVGNTAADKYYACITDTAIPETVNQSYAERNAPENSPPF